jgi:hypothetical protein
LVMGCIWGHMTEYRNLISSPCALNGNTVVMNTDIAKHAMHRAKKLRFIVLTSQ